MGKKARSSSKSLGSNGIGGSGVHGLLGTTILCNSTDNSYYCSFMKFIQISFLIMIICAILYFAYSSLRKKRLFT